MNKAIRFGLVAALLGVGCGDDGGSSGTGTDTDGGTGTTGTTDPGSGPSSSGVDASTTGEPADDTLSPCDPLASSCEDGVCSGSPQSGFYCRPACPGSAQPGAACGDDGVCLKATRLDDTLVCFELADCDILTGEGCNLAAGESCVVLGFDPLRTACVPSGSTGAGQPCDPGGMHDCAPGLACLGSDLEGDDPGVCTPWCIPGAPLPDACAQCIAVTSEIGSCGECSVLDDDCPDGTACQPVNEALGGVCVAHGPGGDGDPCDFTSSCQPGYLCLETDVDDVFACVQKCDRNDPACDDPEKSCIDVGLILPGLPTGELGVCIDTDVPFCNPDAQPTGCGPGQSCLEVEPGLGVCADPCDPTQGQAACEGNYACIPALDGAVHLLPFATGNGACGVGCSSDADCGGGTCLLLDGIEADGVCGTPCDPNNPGCAVGETCVATPGNPDVGACVLSGTPCNPAQDESCLGQTGTMCVALDGGAGGVCMVSCFEQDPAACGGMADACQVKTDAQWHAGVCLGAEPACDPIAQDCGGGLTCGVLGGAAIGGHAFVCDEPGPLPEGGDCSSDADLCGTGLECILDTCMALCDPLQDTCQTGTCVDISLLYYLPADTLGVCM